MVIFIYLCILLLNIVAIFMTYKFLGEDFVDYLRLEKLYREKYLYKQACRDGRCK